MKLEEMPNATLFSYDGRDFLRTAEEVDDNYHVNTEWLSTRIRCVDLLSGDILCLLKTIDVQKSNVKFIVLPKSIDPQIG